jgi:hypothetical protein
VATLSDGTELWTEPERAVHLRLELQRRRQPLTPQTIAQQRGKRRGSVKRLRSPTVLARSSQAIAPEARARVLLAGMVWRSHGGSAASESAIGSGARLMDSSDGRPNRFRRRRLHLVKLHSRQGGVSLCCGALRHAALPPLLTLLRAHVFRRPGHRT